MKVEKPDNPVLFPGLLPWEKSQVCNPAVVPYRRGLRMLYRACGDLREYVCRIGAADSTDGINWRRVWDTPFSYAASIEDPRCRVFIGRNRKRKFVLTVGLRDSAINDDKTGSQPPKYTGIASLENLERESFQKIRFDYPFGTKKDYRDAFPLTTTKMLYRTDDGAIRVRDLPESDYVLYRGTEPWEARKVGLGAPPVYIDGVGVLLIYHGVDKAYTYRAGALLLDCELKLARRLKEPFLVPDKWYETRGITPNVVYPTSALLYGDTLRIWYGAADTYVGYCTVSLQQLLREMEPV